MFRRYNPFLLVVLSVLVSLVLHFHVFSYDLVGYHVWRQTQTQTVINNFCRHGFNIFKPELNNLQFPGGVFRMEFPLYQWLAALFSTTLKHPVLATRIFSFITGVCTVFGFYFLAGRVFRDKWLAAVGAWAFMFSPAFYYYMVNPLPDDLSLCFGIFSLVLFMNYYKRRSTTNLVLCVTFLCLATLTKLPFVLFGTPLLVMFFKKEFGWKQVLLILVLMLPAIAWYISVIDTWEKGSVVAGVFGGGYSLLTYFDYLQHNFISTLPELFINYSALLLFDTGVFYSWRKKIFRLQGPAPYFFWGFIAVTGYALYELNMIAKVHDYYLFPFLPFLFLLITYGYKKLREGSNRFLKIVALVCVTAMPLTAYLRADTRWNVEDPGFNADVLKYKAALQSAIPADSICLTGNDDSEMINLYYLDRKGYTFYNDALDIGAIEKYRQLGVSYLVSDALLSQETLAYLSAPIGEFGSVKIYKLK